MFSTCFEGKRDQIRDQSQQPGRLRLAPALNEDLPGLHIGQYRTLESVGHWTHTLNCTPHLLERINWITSQIG